MKAKKAIKRLHRVETLLGTVIEQFAASTAAVRDLLDAARTGVTSATEALAAMPRKKPPARASRISDAARKRLSMLAKKRWAAAKRTGRNTLAKPSRQTA